MSQGFVGNLDVPWGSGPERRASRTTAFYHNQLLPAHQQLADNHPNFVKPISATYGASQGPPAAVRTTQTGHMPVAPIVPTMGMSVYQAQQAQQQPQEQLSETAVVLQAQQEAKKAQDANHYRTVVFRCSILAVTAMMAAYKFTKEKDLHTKSNDKVKDLNDQQQRNHTDHLRNMHAMMNHHQKRSKQAQKNHIKEMHAELEVISSLRAKEEHRAGVHAKAVKSQLGSELVRCFSKGKSSEIRGELQVLRESDEASVSSEFCGKLDGLMAARSSSGGREACEKILLWLRKEGYLSMIKEADIRGGGLRTLLRE